MRSLWPRGLSGLGGECPTCYTILGSKDIQEDLMETSRIPPPTSRMHIVVTTSQTVDQLAPVTVNSGLKTMAFF